jgi:hypothetical protein
VVTARREFPDALTHATPAATTDDRVQVYRAPLELPGAEPPPLAATRPSGAEHREYARVRDLLFALRPDFPNPLTPNAPEPTAAPQVRIRDPQAGWGGVPSGYGVPRTGGLSSAASAVLARLVGLPEDARALCVWLREYALLETLRGLYVDVGWAFASAAQGVLWSRDLSARRDGTYRHGRTLTLAAATAMGIPGVA